MKRIITYTSQGDGKLLITSISELTDRYFSYKIPEGYGYLDEDAKIPPEQEGKKLKIYYNRDMQSIDSYEYEDLTFDDYDDATKIELLKEENAALKQDNELSQQAIMEIYEIIAGGDQ